MISHDDVMMTSLSISIHREFKSLLNGVGFGYLGGTYAIFYSAYANFQLGPSTQTLTFFKKTLYHSIENQISYRMV